MPHRDPATGKFVSDDMEFNDIEVVSFNGTFGIEASNLDGTTAFTGGDAGAIEGEPLIDYDDVVDRNEELVLLSAQHRLSTWANSTATSDGTVRTYAEVSASPVNTLQAPVVDTALEGNSLGGTVGGAESDDTIDLIMRPLVATAHSPFSDSAGGVGGAGSAGEDNVEGNMFPQEYGRFHPRDELYANITLEVFNIADQGVHADISGQHVYGVMTQ